MTGAIGGTLFLASLVGFTPAIPLAVGIIILLVSLLVASFCAFHELRISREVSKV